MKHIHPSKVLVSIGASLAVLLLGTAISYAATAAVALQTVSNVSHPNDQAIGVITTQLNATTGTNDQTLTIGTTTANVPQVKASRTLTINSVPAAYNATTTIGSCAVTYSTSTADSLNCSGNTATLNTVTHATVASLTSAFASLTNIGSSNGHGTLIVSSTTTSTVTISTAGTEASSTQIAFIDGTGGAVVSSASVSGTVPVAEVLTLTPGGTVEPGDIFTVGIAAVPASVAHTVPGTASTTAGEANGITNALKASGSYASFGFTAATSSSQIVLTASVPGTAFYVTASTTNRVAVTQMNAGTVSGTPEVGDIYKLTIPTGTINYTTVASDTSATNIALDLTSALQASSTYSSQAFTASSSGPVISFAAKTPGTGYSVTGSTTNAPQVAQVVTFTFPAISTNTTYSITINSNTYSYTGSSASAVAAGIAAAASGETAATCVASGSVVTCTATSAGTPFTFSTNATDVTVVSSSGGGGGGGRSGGSVRPTTVSSTASTPTTVTTTGTVPTTVSTTGVATAPMLGGAGKVTATLKYLSRNNSVKALQQLLTADPNIHYSAGVTGYFGLKTQAAVQLFQMTYGVVTTASDPGYGLVGPKTRAALVRVYGK